MRFKASRMHQTEYAERDNRASLSRERFLAASA